MARENPLTWPVRRNDDGSASILIPGYGWKHWTADELASAVVEILGRGDFERNRTQRAILERLCGPQRWREANAIVEATDELLAGVHAAATEMAATS